ncbi:aldehyde dehydrogenase family protein [Histomonas meleagridis]|uniref:aldehyde dehydrogenase family protein n=1 Tax=Histomonas meleagridis TaxID=135588 RepID=UPI003559D9B3|nr:aldehyde dehydrogenase family protein [Histomonas meleagridis]KAH0806603.1 aldehyde dehydrogenase family protein [Histomonas meleagridis]
MIHTTPDEEIPGIVQALRDHYNTEVTRPIQWRIQQLQGLIKVLEEHEDEWNEALNKDMGAHKFEAALLVGAVKSEIKHTIKSLPKWMEPKSLSNPWALYPGSTSVVPEPYGVVCDFIPFNYPVFLGFSSICTILAAGNVCLFKPSSNTPACAKLYQDLFPKYLDPEAVKVVCGPSAICNVILKERFDFIFYTGSPAIAKGVMKAASEHLTPVLLELGGKSPVYVDKNLSIEKCAKRLVWAKIFNGGQTCVAPDYCFIHQDIYDKFKAELVKAISEFYGDVANVYNDNITHIINRRHFDRLTRAIQTSGGEILLEGLRDPEKLYIGPTLIENPSMDSQLMKEEIFGPILPLIKISGVEDAIKYINAHEKPLSLYVYTSDNKVLEQFTKRTSSGSVVLNDSTFHVSSPEMPFGGVGNSGMGQYHGKYGFRQLSHLKPVVTHSTMIDISQRYPPYTDGHLSLLKKFL